MIKWNELSMAERANIIALGVRSGITDLNNIRKVYNSFARGGYTEWKERIREHKGIDIDNDPTYDYEGFYNSNPDRAWDMMNEASDAHFTDEFKTSIHPSFSTESKYSGYKNKYNPNGITGGTWIDDYNYQLSQDQFNNDWDTDRTLDYFNNNENHPVRLFAPDGSTMLRSVTVTPQSSALNRSRNGITSLNDIRTTYNKFGDGGITDDNQDRFISTGNEWLDLGASFIPFVGASMDIEEAIRNPTLGNIGWAAISTALDFGGGSLIKGALKSAKAANKAVDAINTAEKATKRYERALHKVTVNPTKGNRKTVRKAFTAMQEANATRRALAPLVRRRGVSRVIPVQRYSIPSDNTRIINPVTVYGTDALLNATQNIIE